MNDFDYIALYPRDFFGGLLFLKPRQRSLYAYLLLLQADQGALGMSEAELAEHCDAAVSDVEAVLGAKFEFDKEAGGWVNRRMQQERDKAVRKIENKRAAAQKAREAKAQKGSPSHSPSKEREEESRVDSDINPVNNPDINTDNNAVISPKADSIWALTQKVEKGTEFLSDLRQDLERGMGDRGEVKEQIRDLKAKLQGWRKQITNK